MTTRHSRLAGILVLIGLSGSVSPSSLDLAGLQTAESNDAPNEVGRTTPAPQPYLVPHWRIPDDGYARMLQHRQEIKAMRQQRQIEREAAHKARQADRKRWLERWEEQRRLAREKSIEHEQRYRESLGARFPALEAHRKRHAEELERRRRLLDEQRRARWRSLDLIE